MKINRLIFNIKITQNNKYMLLNWCTPYLQAKINNIVIQMNIEYTIKVYDNLFKIFMVHGI